MTRRRTTAAAPARAEHAPAEHDAPAAVVLQPKRPHAPPVDRVARHDDGTPIDLSDPNARRRLLDRYPAPTSERMVDADDDDEAAAGAYLEATDAIRRWEGTRERAAALLASTIRDALGVAGEGWEARWPSRAGAVNWAALVGELRPLVPDLDARIARHRAPATRALSVKRTADADDGGER